MTTTGNKEEKPMNTSTNTLEGLKLGSHKSFARLTMFPLESEPAGGPDYLTLGTALERGLISISEVSRGGSVPELRAANKAELPVLIVDGEELVGAKQNRVANLTVMVPAKTTLHIPVSCVEAGRWSYARDDFVASDRTHFARGRAARFATVSYAMECDGSRHADQGMVWDHIAAKAAELNAPSRTSAMAAIYDRHRTTVDEYVAALGPTQGQTGAVFAIDGAVAGLDLFDRPESLAALLPKLVRSYAVDAIGNGGGEHNTPEPAAAKVFLNLLADAHTDAYPALGLGTDLRLTAPGLVGGGLTVDDHLIHLAAFARSEPASDRPGAFGGMTALHSRRGFFERRS
jgi:hypothetical protein